MNLELIFLMISLLVFCTWVAVSFKKNQKTKSNNIFISFLVLGILLSLYPPIASIIKYLTSHSYETYVIDSIKPINNSKNFIDIGFTKNHQAVAFYFNQQTKQFEGLFLFPKNKKEKISFELNATSHSFLNNSPYVQLPISYGNLSAKESQKLIKEKKVTSIQFKKNNQIFWLPNTHFNTYYPEFSDNGLYFVMRTNDFYNLFHWDLKNSIRPIPKDNSFAHYYNPYYWKQKKSLFFIGLLPQKRSEKTSYAYKLYALLNDGSSFSTFLSIKEKPSLDFFSIKGNADGSFFIHTMNKNHNQLIAYPSAIFNHQKKNQPTILTFKDFHSIQSFVFHPIDPLKILLIGSKNKFLDNDVFSISFKKKYKKPIHYNQRWIYHTILVIIALFIVTILIIIKKNKNLL